MSVIVLNADDYAMTDGVSRSIEALAFQRRLSATSVMTTMPEWPTAAPRLAQLRDRVAIGLHLNLTLGAPAAAMRNLAPGGVFPPLGTLVLRALSRRLEPLEIRAEIARQFDLFDRYLGFPPDHVDGHQHVQVLPIVRSALIEEMSARYGASRPLLRDPSDAASQLFARGAAGAKALVVKGLSAGLSRAAKSKDLPVNGRFAGFSAFDTAQSYADEITAELARSQASAGGLSVIMCHPGYPDAALAAIDPVTERRQQEHDTIMQMEGLEARIWHPNRSAHGPAIDWSKLI